MHLVENNLMALPYILGLLDTAGAYGDWTYSK